MNIRRFFTPQVCYAPDAEGGGGSAEGADAGGAAADAVAAEAGAGGEGDTAAAEQSLLGGAKSDADGGEQGGSDQDGAAEKDKAKPEGDGAGDEAGKAGDDKGDGEKSGDDAAPFEGLTPPEGFEQLDETALAEATPILRALGVETPERAQEVVNQFAPILKGMIERSMEQNTQAFMDLAAQTRTQWAKDAMADPEIGGGQAKLNQNLATAAKALDRFGTPALREMLDETGIGNHPELIRAWAKVGKAISEDSFHRSDGTAQERVAREDKFYPATAAKA